ncbi:MAG: S-layer homology domain-containing protein [Oscillospiraceae bacterium]
MKKTVASWSSTRPQTTEKEKFVWTINEPVSNFSRVQLSYQLRLRDDARTSTDGYFYTNVSATLKPKDSEGYIGREQTFDRPRVTFGADADYLLPILNLKKATPKLNTRDHFAYVQGYPDGTVKPAGSITRAEVAAILFRLMDADSRSLYYSTASGFRDVDSTKWYNTYVATLNNAGVITDSRTGYFRPNDAITRAELAAMLAQFAEKKSAAIYFSDVSAGYWAANAIALTANLGWINGYPDGTFGPDKTVTRAELMAMVNRATGRAPKSTGALLSGMKTWKDNADTARWYYLDVQEATNSHTYTGAPTETWTSLTATPTGLSTNKRPKQKGTIPRMVPFYLSTQKSCRMRPPKKPPLPGEVARRSRDGEVVPNL